MRYKRKLLHHPAPGCVVILLVVILAGCSAENGLQRSGGGVGGGAGSAGDSPSPDGGLDSGASTAGTGGAGTDGAVAGSGGAQSDSGGSYSDSGGSLEGGGGTEADAGTISPVDGGLVGCATVTREAEQIEIVTEETVEVTVSEPIAMYFMLDSSGSMSGEKWQIAVYAINKFIGATASENIDIALQYFPIPAGGCDGSGYDEPAVPLGRLPDHANNITRSLAQTQPTGGNTPTEGALRGVTAFCAQYKQNSVVNPDGEDCLGVLISDGAPNGCTVNDALGLAAIAGDASTDNQVMTFAIGMTGANFNVLNAIAEAGGTDCDPDGPNFACDVSAGTGDDLLAVLELIRDTVTETRIEERIEYQTEVLECEWELPEPPPDGTFDRQKVNVKLSDEETGEVVFGQVPDADRCGDELGWYYDDPDDPTKILACPETCAMIQEAIGAKIDIVLGCLTIILLE